MLVGFWKGLKPEKWFTEDIDAKTAQVRRIKFVFGMELSTSEDAVYISPARKCGGGGDCLPSPRLLKQLGMANGKARTTAPGPSSSEPGN